MTVSFQIGICLWALTTAALVSTVTPAKFEALLNATQLAVSDGLGAASDAVGSVDLGSGAPSELGTATSTVSDGLTLAAGFVGGAKSEDTIHATIAYGIFMLLWLINFVRMVGWTVMAGAFCYWYFFSDDDPADPKMKSSFPILGSVYRTFRYHLGTVAFASLIVAICQVNGRSARLAGMAGTRSLVQRTLTTVYPTPPYMAVHPASARVY